MDEVRQTILKKGTTIGANATIVCGVTLDKYSFIEASEVITKNAPDHTPVAGNPGKQIGYVCECRERLAEKLKCTVCGKAYQKNGESLKTLRDNQLKI